MIVSIPADIYWLSIRRSAAPQNSGATLLLAQVAGNKLRHSSSLDVHVAVATLTR
jgi:hypothetical protein